MLSLKSHKEICCEPGCCSPGIQKRACLFPKQPFAADKQRAKGNIWRRMAIERVGELGSATGAAQPGLSWAWVCDPLGFVLFYGAGEVWESCNRIFSLETILFPYRISCISLLSLPFTKILTYKPMFVLLSSFSLPTYFPSEIMRWTICRNNIFDKYTPFSFSQIIWEQTLIFYYFVHYLKYLSNCLQ